MTTDPDLLLRASSAPGILDGWCGPALVDGVPAVVIRRADRGGDFYDCVKEGAPWIQAQAAVAAILLDLARPEAADRAARWLAGATAGQRPIDIGASGPCWFETTRRWVLDAVRGHHTFGPVDDPPITHTVVPALASLDPADPRTTATGARWVDLRALLLCCEHVGASR